MTQPFITPFMRGRRLAIAGFFFLVMVVPPLEVFSFTAVYLLLTPEQHAAVANAANIVGIPATADQAPWLLLGAATLAIAGIAYGRFMRMRFLANLKYGVYEDVFRTLMRRLLRLPPWALARENREEIAAIAVSEVGSVPLMAVAALGIASNLVAMLVLVLASAAYNPGLVLLALALGALTMLVNRANFAQMQVLGAEKVGAQKELIRDVHEVLVGMDRIKMDGLEQAAMNRFERTIKTSRSWRQGKMKVKESVTIISDVVSTGAIFLLAFAGTVFLGVEAGVFIVLLLVFNRLRGYVTALQGDYVTFRGERPAYRRVAELSGRISAYDDTPRPDGPRGPFSVTAAGAALQYGERADVLANVSFTVAPADRIVVRGPSGHGKSSLLKLLVGYHRPEAGVVELISDDGRRPVAVDGFGESLFYSANEFPVFALSVRDNVDFAGTASDEAVRDALRQACLLDYDDSWTLGLDDPVGEKGHSLSLGQRQRLLLARAFLRHPRLVILDEATSGLDLETERRVLQNLVAHVGPEGAMLFVTHRPTDAVAFTQSWHVEEGRLTVGGPGANGTDAPRGAVSAPASKDPFEPSAKPSPGGI